ncbi:MAG: MoxR family ATPase [Crocosphaera sp.]|nr:MoxR family ATPase [Crocosphaera sp.]
MKKKPLTYTGTIQPNPGIYYEPIQREIYPYTAEENLIEVVNLAIDLGMPLLLEGEPGCGKSRLAHALVYEFNYRKKNKPIKYYEWTVQSTSKAEESLYQYDYIGRLQAAQIKQSLRESSVTTTKTNDQDSSSIINQENSPQKASSTNQTEDKDNEINNKLSKDPANPKDWVNLQPLGKAFKQSQDYQEQSVVLIDEIDKADRDFPNDLLLAIESRCFFIKETEDNIQADRENFPLIIITSNQEKNLPNAFLRRCIYHYIEFPKQHRLIEILTKRFTDAEQEVIIEAVNRFMQVREAQEDNKPPGEKKVSTSELIFWFKSLSKYKPDIIKKKLKEKKIPHAGILLKSRDDLQEYGEV